MIKDRLINGTIAGSAGAIIQNGYALLMSRLGYSGPVYIDYGKILLFYNPPQGILPNGLGLVAHFVWDIILAVLFAYLLQKTSSRYLWLKGLIYGIAVWFFIKTGATLYKIPIIYEVRPYTVAFFLGGAILFGIIIASTLQFMEQTKLNV